MNTTKKTEDNLEPTDLDNLETLYDVTELDYVEYYNSYDDLNEYFVNSYDTDCDKSNAPIKKRGKLHVISNDDEIRFIHTDDVSARHNQIHAEEPKKTQSKKTDDPYAAKKAEIRDRLNAKVMEKNAKAATASTNRTYTASQLSSRETTEAYSRKKKKETNPKKLMTIIFTVLFILPSLMESCEDVFTDNYSYEDSYDDFTYKYEGDRNNLVQIYEQDDTEKTNPYYYDESGIIYDCNYEEMYYSDCSDYNFEKNHIAEIKRRELYTNHHEEDGFIDAFIDPKTLNVYYIVDNTFYNYDEEQVDSFFITIPDETIQKLSN